MEQEYINSLTPETREILSKSDEERINYVKTEKFIMYPRAKEILNKMEELMMEPKRSRMPCLLIVGDSNSGKTSLWKKLLRMYPPTDGMEEAALPVVALGAPSTPDVSALLDRIMRAMELPFKKSDSITAKENLIHYHFRNLEVKMLVIDEIHNLLSGSVARQKVFMNEVKNLSIEMEIPIVLVGIKEALHATDTDLQISSRFRPILLPRWKLDRDYVSFLVDIESTLPFKKPSGIARDRKMAESILDLSDGLLGEIVHIITVSALHAIKTGREKITMDIIKECEFDKPSQRRGTKMVE